MDYETLQPYFEISVNPSIDDFLWLLIIGLIVFVLGSFKPIVKHLEQAIKVSITNVKRGVLGLFLFALFITFNKYQSEMKIVDAVTSGNTKTVSGCIQNYTLSKAKSEEVSFTINGILFEYNNYTRTPFFYERESSGEVFRNGNCFEIEYIEDGGRNGIVKIVELTSE